MLRQPHERAARRWAKGEDCRQGTEEGSPEEGHAVAGAAYDAIKTSNANIVKLSNDIEMLYKL